MRNWNLGKKIIRCNRCRDESSKLVRKHYEGKEEELQMAMRQHDRVFHSSFRAKLLKWQENSGQGREFDVCQECKHIAVVENEGELCSRCDAYLCGECESQLDNMRGYCSLCWQETKY